MGINDLLSGEVTHQMSSLLRCREQAGVGAGGSHRPVAIQVGTAERGAMEVAGENDRF